MLMCTTESLGEQITDAKGVTKSEQKEGWFCQEKVGQVKVSGGKREKERERENVSGTTTEYRQSAHCQLGPAD